MTNSFSFNRLFQLMKREIYQNSRILFLAIGSFFAVAVFIILLRAIFDDSLHTINPEHIFFPGLFGLGIFISGMAFPEFRSKERTITFLTLPASTIEKFLATLILASLGFIVIYTIMFIVFNLFMSIVLQPFDISMEIFDLDKTYLRQSLFDLIKMQSIFLLGAVVFKKVPLFFTILTIFVLSLLSVTLIAGVAQLSGIGDNSNTLFFNTSSSVTVNGEEFNDFWAIKGLNYLGNYLLPPILWVVTYFKIKEKEI